MGSRQGNRVSRSVNGIRKSVSVFRMASSFSPARDFNNTLDFSPKLRNGNRVNSVIPPRDREFDSQEPTSPKVSCIGHIKMKPPQRAKPPKQAAADKAAKDNNNSKLSNLKKLMSRRHNKSNKAEEEEKGEEEKNCYLSLGQIKRYASGSYDAKFGTMFVQECPIVVNLGSFTLEAAAKEEGGINIWKRRSIPPLAALEVDRNVGVQRFEARTPFTT